MDETPDYGTADHYLGEKGEEYFAWQGGPGDFGGRINTHKFRHLIRPSDTVIDFGCGGGFLLKNLTCSRRIGIEINPAARRVASGLGIECYAAVTDVPDGVADVIVSDHALEHVPFPIAALKQLRTKLKPGGVLSICVPHDNYWEDRHYDPKQSEPPSALVDARRPWEIRSPKPATRSLTSGTGRMPGRVAGRSPATGVSRSGCSTLSAPRMGWRAARGSK